MSSVAASKKKDEDSIISPNYNHNPGPSDEANSVNTELFSPKSFKNEYSDKKQTVI
jgi:hypothetical protein